MSCNYCRLPERNEPAFDILRKMVELNRLGVKAEISTDDTYCFKIRLDSGNVEIVRFIAHYHIPFMEQIIDGMLQDLKKGAQL